MLRFPPQFTGCLAVLLLFLVACEGTNNTATQKDTNPNIILLMADDHGWGDTGYNGNDTILTPHLDRMAGSGLQFNRFYAAAPVCSPTRGSCITGRHPYRYGIYTANAGMMKPEEITLAEAVKTKGYRTGHFGKWHLGTLTNDTIDANRGGRKLDVYSPPWDNGFDVCFSTESKVPTWDPMITPSKEALDVGNRTPGDHFGTFYWTGPGQIETDNLEGDDSRVIMDRAIPFVQKSVESDEPFLAVIWFHTPHLPVLTGEKYRNMYPGMSEDIQHYYGCITAMDEQIGRLLTTLEELGADENTLIFYTSDNGPEGATRINRTQGSTNGLRGRKRSLYEGGVRVPGIMYWPERITQPSKVDLPVSTSDYYPTILDILDIEMHSQPMVDGISLVPLLEGKMDTRPTPIGFQFKDQLSWVEGKYKLYSPDQGESWELYDIDADPGETSDISTENGTMVTRLRSDLLRWVESCEKSNQGSDYK
ncbi:MAG: sulfatase-like hydrolase/transferase [Cyclobacteriaceae bacterium]|nr:sulfatase-like hydrolase/transferase [Cyclobacteriaceae bacterium SS2]